MSKNYLQIIDSIYNWIKKTLQEANSKGFVYGVSGGIDSALICAIASKYFKENSVALRMDIFNSKKDIEDANLVINTFKVKSINLNLEDVYNIFIKNLPENDLAKMNLKSRLRMNMLYYYAQSLNYLVCGTSNACEIYTGYFTKYGDSGSDFMPLANLTKADVYECAKLLNVPNAIITKAPSAGLSDNQTDEKDLKVSYDEINKFLNHQTILKTSQERIEYLHNISEHKRNMSKTMLPLGTIIK